MTDQTHTRIAEGRVGLGIERVTLVDLHRIVEGLSRLSAPADLLTAAYLDPDPSASFRKDDQPHWPSHDVRVVYVRNESPVTIMLETSPYVLAALVLFFKYPDKVATVFLRYRIARNIAKLQLRAVETWRDQVATKGMGVDVSDLPAPPSDWLKDPHDEP